MANLQVKTGTYDTLIYNNNSVIKEGGTLRLCQGSASGSGIAYDITDLETISLKSVIYCTLNLISDTTASIQIIPNKSKNSGNNESVLSLDTILIIDSNNDWSGTISVKIPTDTSSTSLRVDSNNKILKGRNMMILGGVYSGYPLTYNLKRVYPSSHINGTYTPTYVNNGGLSTSPTKIGARYQVIGNRCFVDVAFSGMKPSSGSSGGYVLNGKITSFPVDYPPIQTYIKGAGSMGSDNAQWFVPQEFITTQPVNVVMGDMNGINVYIRPIGISFVGAVDAIVSFDYEIA